MSEEQAEAPAAPAASPSLVADAEKVIGGVTQTVGNVLGSVGGAVLKLGDQMGLNIDPSSGSIFLTGGTGVIGYRVAMRLLKAGYPTVRVGSRSPTKVEELNKLGAEIADFNWDNDETYAKALAGVKSVLCLTPYHEGWEKQFPLFIMACKHAGVKHIVKVSFYHARVSGDMFQDVPLVRTHGNCDEMLIKSGIPYTILAATHIMSNPLVHQGKELRSDQKPATFYGASAGKGVNYVSPNDIAEVAVRALLDHKSHDNKEYTLTGPEAITDQQVAELLGKHLEKPVMYVDQPEHTFADGEKMSGDPEWMVKDLVALEKIKASGKEEDVAFISKDIETLCGRKAETFEEYLLAKEYMTPQEAA